MSQPAEWQTHPIYTRDDGSYVVTLHGYPYHVPPATDEFADLWAEVNAWAKAHPNAVQPEPGPPPPTLEEAKTAKLAEIAAGYDAALVATLTMPTASPSAAQVSTEAALFAATDPDGLSDVLTILAARRDVLTTALEAAATVADVQAIEVTYPV